jgi:glycogen phosphorylase
MLLCVRAPDYDEPAVTPRALHTFTVKARLPEELAPLSELAMNLRWSWDPRTQDLFRWIDPEGWDEGGSDPMRILARASTRRLEELSADPGFMEFMTEVHADLVRYLRSDRWFQHRDTALRSVAYFSPEFGLSEAVPQYSGGLGVLAGDHMKAASGLGIPIVGVGLFYRQGYFRQALNPDGWQEERYPLLDPHAMALTPVTEATVEVNVAGRPLRAQVWRADIGRAPLYLLCSDVEENEPSLRVVTDRLYGGNAEHRIAQEILLGMGGTKALEVVGVEPQVFHMNEGHAGFSGLERIRRFISKEGLTFPEAIEAVRASTAFTTHTPVTAGIDKFPYQLMRAHFLGWAEECGAPFNELMALGHAPGAPEEAEFNMAIMGLRLSARSNGVSKLHGRVSRAMFKSLWPEVPEEEIPIGSVTNGVHARSWVAPDMSELYDRHVMPEWQEADRQRWAHIESARDDELWRVKEHARERLVVTARRLLKASLLQEGAVEQDLEWIEEVLDPKLLTIGFAKRFAEYKRPTLLLRQPGRLRKLLLSADRPLQLVFAGKAHPADDPGKKMIRELLQFARDPELRHRIVFIPDYDMAIARTLCQGADVWLNMPRRPMEACGTSGQKAAMNGSLNLSTLDGWWDEWFDGNNGWAIASAETYEDLSRRDDVEAASLFEILERQVIPKFYDRRGTAVPREWVRMVKSSLKSLVPRVSASRMLRDYLSAIYEPLAESVETLHANDYQRAKALAEWKRRVSDGWSRVRIEFVDSDVTTTDLGEQRRVETLIDLGDLHKSDVAVQLVHGPVGLTNELQTIRVAPMAHFGEEVEGSRHRYRGSFVCEVAGRYGFSVRIVPSHQDLASYTDVGRITWA